VAGAPAVLYLNRARSGPLHDKPNIRVGGASLGGRHRGFVGGWAGEVTHLQAKRSHGPLHDKPNIRVGGWTLMGWRVQWSGVYNAKPVADPHPACFPATSARISIHGCRLTWASTTAQAAPHVTHSNLITNSCCVFRAAV